ncbi:hypothetical protein Ocin01_16629 [Orchesella cincta]|uniref:Uncharacterized protein n=1 Tax=Orchesella cincta TaxID=48709 RepID=A0A1D2MAP9_ORCCI|nr:hypothetical protein Ocin01_16629 [Orchesella cincta]
MLKKIFRTHSWIRMNIIMTKIV